MSHQDRQLVEAVLANAPSAFERLVREYQGLCWHIIYRMVRHPEDARELCQETFLRVHQHLRQYRYESGLKSWIGRIAYTVALRYLERKRITVLDPGRGEDSLDPVENLSDGFDLETAYSDSEVAACLHRAIEALPPLQRTVLTLYHLDELSIDEIANITGLATGTIKSHLFRTRLRLREQLETVYGVSP
ncbi:RNA polymerase sigma factor [Dyella nitratireducens]|uniref:RNA polymerase sigma24 factor n=1 Tax=Dyella nitratireducens TaxID=1849580 RepID=A0ABQ1G113_9GAMM|nr:sigma-70 family RNA polymerase sigma factor [Dyella nitratireducens]GGA35396.1 RNA polymerase sigma24 factor [Dyella nitratireducens]GLQ40996.1 RNA polymerase sigma24 factor [Dyella nitratireducens]